MASLALSLLPCASTAVGLTATTCIKYERERKERERYGTECNANETETKRTLNGTLVNVKLNETEPNWKVFFIPTVCGLLNGN